MKIARLLGYIFLPSLLFFGQSCNTNKDVNEIYEAYVNDECHLVYPIDSKLMSENLDNPDFWYFQGLCSLKTGEYGKARNSFLEAQKLNSEYKAYVLFGLSVCELNLGNRQDGYRYLASAMNFGLLYRYIDHPFLEKFNNSPGFKALKEEHRPQFDFWTSAILFMALQGIILSMFLIFKRPRNPKNIYLGGIVIIYSFLISAYSLSLSNFNYYFPYFDNIHHPLLYLIGPFVYLYFRTILTSFKFSLSTLKHFLPSMFIILVVVLTKFGLLKFFLSDLILNSYLKTMHMFIYGIFTYLLFKSHFVAAQKEIRRWFVLIMSIYAFFVLANAYHIVDSYLSLDTLVADVLLILSMCFFIILTGLMGYIQPKIFSGQSLKSSIGMVKYGRTGLSPKLSEELKDKLLTKMTKDKLYLKNDLSLDELSEIMSVSRHHLSQLINENFDMGFYDFINKFRIEDAIQVIQEKNTTIIESAYIVGFNNKTSFFAAFKKFKNSTPSNYLKKVKRASKSSV